MARCVLACTLVVAAGHASAQDVAQLGSAIEADKVTMVSLQTDMNQKTSDNERLKKEYDIYADQLKTRIAPMVTNYNTQLNGHNQHAARVNAAVAAHNAVCHGTLPRPTFERCQGESPQLQRMIDGVNSAKRNLDGEKARIQGEQTRYKNAMDPLSAKMKANFAIWTQDKARFDQLRAKIASAQTAILDRCKNASPSERNSPQFLKYCASFGFDNPNPNLKPLDEQTAPKGTRITPN